MTSCCVLYELAYCCSCSPIGAVMTIAVDLRHDARRSDAEEALVDLIGKTRGKGLPPALAHRACVWMSWIRRKGLPRGTAEDTLGGEARRTRADGGSVVWTSTKSPCQGESARLLARVLDGAEVPSRPATATGHPGDQVTQIHCLSGNNGCSVLVRVCLLMLFSWFRGNISFPIRALPPLLAVFNAPGPERRTPIVW